MMPSLLAARPSSASDMIMRGSDPRRRRFADARPRAWSPQEDHGHRCPWANSELRRRMVRGSASPTSTVHNDNLSASECRRQSRTLPLRSRWVVPSRIPATDTRSTSVPVRARRREFVHREGDRYEFCSQEIGAFMNPHSELGAGSAGRSRREAKVADPVLEHGYAVRCPCEAKPV